LIDPTVSDNCAVQSLTNDAPSSFPLGDTDVIWTVTDSAGNTNTCTQIVTVVDDVDPVVTCPADSVETINEGDLYTIPDFSTIASATDNCTASPLITQDPIAGTEVGVGDTTVTITATDDAGNESVCTFTITVEYILGTGDRDYDKEIVLFPNPTNGNVTLLNNSDLLINSVIIFDINGRVINEITINGTNLESNFSIENQATGLYFVKIVSNDFSIIKKIVKK
jgi:extracellular elastinolytic metalloproteinase